MLRLGRQPVQRIGKKATLQDEVKLQNTVIEELRGADFGGEGSGADSAVVVATVGYDDFDVRPVNN